MGRDIVYILLTIGVCGWIAWDVRERKPISTSEWLRLMRKYDIGVDKNKKAA